MSRDRQKGFAVSLLLSGFLVLFMGLAGSWGSVAYGQTGGPPPQQPAVPPAVGGAEGEAPASGPPEAVAGESGVSDATVEGTPSLIASTGAASGMQWSLLLAGMLLLAGGGVMFARARKAQ